MNSEDTNGGVTDGEQQRNNNGRLDLRMQMAQQDQTTNRRDESSRRDQEAVRIAAIDSVIADGLF